MWVTANVCAKIACIIWVIRLPFLLLILHYLSFIHTSVLTFVFWYFSTTFTHLGNLYSAPVLWNLSYTSKIYFSKNETRLAWWWRLGVGLFQGCSNYMSVVLLASVQLCVYLRKKRWHLKINHQILRIVIYSYKY